MAPGAEGRKIGVGSGINVRFVCCCLMWILASIAIDPVLRAEEPALFRISKYSGALILQFQNTVEVFTLDDHILSDIARRYVEAGLSLNVTGSVYHPGLLTFNADLKLLSFNSKEVRFSEASSNNDLNNTYNVNLSFLNNRKLNFRLFALRDYNSADRRFRERYFVRSEKYGLSAANTSALLPFRLSVFRLKTVSESLSYRERDEQSDHIEFDLKLLKKTLSTSNFRLRWKDYAERVFGNNYSSLDLSGDFNLFYGRESENHIMSSASYRRMNSVFILDTVQISNSFKHHLSEDLFAGLAFSFQRSAYSGSASVSNDLELSLNHKLFESLRSAVLGGFDLSRAGHQDYDRFFAGFELNYKKMIPTGSLSIRYTGRYSKGDYRSKSKLADSSRVVSFSLSDSIILAISGISRESIRITDTDLSRLYIEGIDYDIETDGISVIITRIPGGDIPERSTIRVFYEFLSYPDYRSDIHYGNLGLSLTLLRNLRVFYRKESNDQTVNSEFLVLPYEQFSREGYGADFNSRFLGASYYREDYLSATSGYNTENFNVSARAGLFRILRVNASYYSNTVDYSDGELFGNFRALMCEVSVVPSVNMRSRMMYRRFRYETFSTDRLRESLIFRLNWKIRKIILDIYYEHILNSYGLSSDRHDYVSLMIRRVF